MKKIRKILEKFGLLKATNIYENKGGWPGLRVLPKVDNLIDVGIGHQGSEGLYKFFPNSRKFFIDPLIETKNAVEHHLKNSENKFYECGVSSKQGEMELNVRTPISQSGFHVSESDSSRAVKKRSVKVNTLDNLFPRSVINGTWGIKIDVEGHEMEVLLGGVELIKHCDFVIVEVEINKKKFSGSSKFGDIITWMLDMKFEVVALRVSGDGTDLLDVAFAREEYVGD